MGKKHEKTYLGDGAYVEWDGWAFELTAPRGDGVDRVVLEDSVLAEFLKFVERVRPGVVRDALGSGT